MPKPKAFMNWSSGKDSTMALYAILQDNQYCVERLLTTVNRKYDRVSMHGLHRSLLEVQAKAIGIPLETVELPENPSMEEYDQLMSDKVASLVAEELTHSIFGDIFLEDLRQYREEMLHPLGVKTVFPLWKKDTKQLLLDFIAQGFRAVVVCCNAQLLPESFCGCLLDRQFLADLPDNVDPCGENGEFHTFCFDGPIFKSPIPFSLGERILRTYDHPTNKTLPPTGVWFIDVKMNK
ncbi:MAG: diphthine--ammonia ligase [Bacteroidota bacterium]